MSKMFLLASEPVSDFAAAFFPIFRIVVVACIALATIITIVAVFMQLSNNSGQGNVITGNRESYYAQNKGSNRQGRITRLIIICVSLIAVFSILYFLSFIFYRG